MGLQEKQRTHGEPVRPGSEGHRRSPIVVDISKLPVAAHARSASGEHEVSIESIDLSDQTFHNRVSMDIKELKQSILDHGQQVAVVLRRVPGRGKLQIVCGFRRTTALAELGRSSVRAVIRDDLSDEQAFITSLLENMHRSALSDVDRGYAILKYRRQFGKSVEEVGALLKLKRRQILRLQQLTTFPTVVQEAIQSGKLLTTHALVLMTKIGTALSEDMLRGWIDRVQAAGMTIETLQRELHTKVAERRVEPGARASLFRTSTKRGATKPSVRIKAMAFDLDAISVDERSALRSELAELMALLA